MSKDNDDKVVLFLRSIPKDVKQKFKVWCAENNITMNDKIVELMRNTYDDAEAANGPSTQSPTQKTGSKQAG